MNIQNGRQFVANLGAIITVRLLAPQFIGNQLAAVEGQLKQQGQGRGAWQLTTALLAGKKHAAHKLSRN